MGSVVFYAVAVVTLLGAFGVVMSRNIVHAALFLLTALAGVAGLFVLLYAEFLALVQVLIYGGAITIVILFAVMLTRSGEYQGETETRRWPFAALAAIGLFALMATAFTLDVDLYNSGVREGVPLETLAKDLFELWAIPFEVASLVLLVALVGAVVIGRAERSEDESYPEIEEQRGREAGASRTKTRDAGHGAGGAGDALSLRTVERRALLHRAVRRTGQAQRGADADGHRVDAERGERDGGRVRGVP